MPDKKDSPWTSIGITLDDPESGLLPIYLESRMATLHSFRNSNENAALAFVMHLQCLLCRVHDASAIQKIGHSVYVHLLRTNIIHIALTYSNLKILPVQFQAKPYEPLCDIHLIQFIFTTQ